MVRQGMARKCKESERMERKGMGCNGKARKCMVMKGKEWKYK
jgi:hypothetical protein